MSNIFWNEGKSFIYKQKYQNIKKQLKGGEANFSFCKVLTFFNIIMQNQLIFHYYNINIRSVHDCTPSSLNIIHIWGPLTDPFNVKSPKKYQIGAATI